MEFNRVRAWSVGPSIPYGMAWLTAGTVRGLSVCGDPHFATKH